MIWDTYIPWGQNRSLPPIGEAPPRRALNPAKTKADSPSEASAGKEARDESNPSLKALK